MVNQEEEVMVVTVMMMTGEERGWTLHCMEIINDHPDYIFCFIWNIFWRKINKAHYQDRFCLSK